MKLWTIQPETIYQAIQETGVYHCDFSKSIMQYWKRQYDWLVSQMESRIGPPPSGVTYPVWAWHTIAGKRKKPDLRQERWHCGTKEERFVCMEIEIPDDQVLLSDFDAWSIILLNGLLSETEEEDDSLEKEYEKMSPEEQRSFQEAHWEKVFNLCPRKNDWITRGEYIQATFWELRREQIKKVQSFVSTARIIQREKDNLSGGIQSDGSI